MPLIYFRGDTNFGDAMNPLFWPRIFPDFERLCAERDVFGIGTLLAARRSDTDPARPKLVLGTGGGYRRPPRLDDRWDIAWVRGPLTAAALGLPADAAVSDPAHLLPHVMPELCRVTSPRGRALLVPHHVSARLADWPALARALDMDLCLPTEPLAEVVRAIRSASCVHTESLHGAILADTFRIPWTAVVSNKHFNAVKWQDWGRTVGVDVAFRYFPRPYFSRPLGAAEALGNRLRRGLAGAGLAPARYRMLPTRPVLPADVAAFAGQLQAVLSQARPQLSAAGTVESLQARMLERLEGVRRRYGLQWGL